MNRIAKIAAMIALIGSAARADAIKPWSGATASARVFESYGSPGTQQAGSSASVSESKALRADYYNANNGRRFKIDVWGSARAEATGRAEGLLRVTAGFGAPAAGTNPRFENPMSVHGSAGWNGDRVTIAPPEGGALPGSVRLNFAFTVHANQGPSDYDFSRFGITLDDRSAKFGFHVPGSYPAPDDIRLFDDFSRIADPFFHYFPSEMRGTFHVDLPVDASGLSDPFRLGLTVDPAISLLNSSYFVNNFDASISLTSITTTDGTLLSDLGTTVTFDSGMLAPGVQPSPVPEPSSLAVAAVVVAAGMWLRRRPARGMRPHLP